MKPHTPLPHESTSHVNPLRSSHSGIALVIVLGMLVLVAVLVIAFLSSVSTELQSSKSYASGSDVRTLADSAVNIVISQIQDATTSGTVGASGTYSFAWASQPGMIRNYDNGGHPVTAYKLYSSSQLRVSGSFNPVSNLSSEIPGTWASSPALYTDLNKPVTVGTGSTAVTHYPIIDPSAVAPSQALTGTALSGTYTPIEGCYLNSGSNIVATSASQSDPIPLPVQWLYVLKSGSVSPMVSGTVAGAGATLPDGTLDTIVGRIAFWTDDESCKVNINTASEGTFWDRPMADGTAGGYEQTLNSSSPVQNEFQRYPGHPAMTCLSPIFPPLSGETDVQYKQRIYGIIPRLAGGGSLAGTQTVTGTTAPLVPNTQRLFASVDEFLFSGTSMDSGTRQANPSGPSSNFSQNDIERIRFFLTANSRAPEVNLFNKPRVTLWPLQANTANISDPIDAPSRNANDKLIAFCSTIGSGASAKPYYFQRYNTFDPTKVRGAGSYDPSSLQNPIPSSQSPSMDWSLIQRNQDLFTYLQTLIKTPIPGLGGSLAGASGKYTTAVGDQILTEMMDYIRSYVNTYHSKASNAVSTDTPYYTYAPFAADASGNASGWVTGQGQVVPLVITPPGATYQTKGFGRFSTITQASLVFYRTDALQYVPNPATASSVPQDFPVSGVIPGNITVLDVVPGVPLTIPPFPPYTPPAASPLATPPRVPTMRAVLLLQTFNPSPGMPPWNGNFRCRVTGLDSLNVTMGGSSVPLGFPASATNLVDGQGGANYYDTTALTQFEVSTEYYPNSLKTLGSNSPGSATEEQFYPFFSGSIPLTASTFDISGSANITVQIYSGYSNPNGINPSDLVQTINMTIPSTSTGGVGLPIPNVPYSLVVGGTSSSSNQYTNYNTRLADPGFNSNSPPHVIRNYIIGPLGLAPDYRGDTVRSVQARYGFAGGGGDYRLIAGLATVPATYFEGHGLIDPTTDNLTYNSTGSNAKLMHSLRSYPSTGSEDNAKRNGFYANANYATGMTYPSVSHGRLVAQTLYLDPTPAGGARPSLAPVAAQGMKGAFMDKAGTIPGDWDNGPGIHIDGPFINKADEGNSDIGWLVLGSYQTAGTVVDTGASFSPNRQISSAVAFGSLPSGIDPSNPSSSIPWRTLLFCKNPASGTAHPGFGTQVSGTVAAPPYTIPPDNAFLDLFTMPVVEPYAISDPFSTAGKVNMNYQIVPFTYLTRDTAVRAVLKSTNIMAIPTQDGQFYKADYNGDGLVPNPPPDLRYNLNLDESAGTLAGFEQRFGSGDIFRSASEICDIYLVPQYLMNGTGITSTTALGPPTYSQMASWWPLFKLTGDNVREQPYGQIYPRLTTKSNTYTVHVQTQSLKKATNTPANQFIPSQDQVTGEFRGSFIVQRYLDPDSDSLVHIDGKTTANENDPDAMVGPYKFRVISTKRFAP